MITIPIEDLRELADEIKNHADECKKLADLPGTDAAAQIRLLNKGTAYLHAAKLVLDFTTRHVRY